MILALLVIMWVVDFSFNCRDILLVRTCVIEFHHFVHWLKVFIFERATSNTKCYLYVLYLGISCFLALLLFCIFSLSFYISLEKNKMISLLLSWKKSLFIFYLKYYSRNKLTIHSFPHYVILITYYLSPHVDSLTISSLYPCKSIT